ncbi:hypothetical protein CR513_14216, partial [Mucuna pruriens]
MVERFGGMINNITNRGRLTFSKEEVPAEGRGHNQPLHISVKYGDYMIAMVLIDNDSSLNVLPKTSSVVVRAFDRSKREVMGEISLPIYIGPTVFNVTFKLPPRQALDSRSWSRTFLPSPKSEVHHGASADQRDRREGTSTTNINPKNPNPSKAEAMAVRVMIKEGYQPGKGLGPHLNGIPARITIQENVGKARLNYHGVIMLGTQSPSQVELTLSQYFVKGSIAMIDDEPPNQSEWVYATDKGPANWTTKALPNLHFLKITNKESPQDGNTILMCEDPS